MSGRRCRSDGVGEAHNQSVDHARSKLAQQPNNNHHGDDCQQGAEGLASELSLQGLQARTQHYLRAASLAART